MFYFLPSASAAYGSKYPCIKDVAKSIYLIVPFICGADRHHWRSALVIRTAFFSFNKTAGADFSAHVCEEEGSKFAAYFAESWPDINLMDRFFLLRRRNVWVPTLPGWLLLIALGAAAILLAGRGLYSFLAPDAPIPGARLLVVEGWLGPAELDQAIAACRRGEYQQVVTTGGPMEKWLGTTIRYNDAELAAQYLRTHGLSDVPVAAVPAPASAQNRTFLSAVMVRRWLAEQDPAYGSLDLFSSGAHARRSHRLYRLALGSDVEIGVITAHPSGYDGKRWWQTSAGVKNVLSESIGWLWTACCFRPPSPDSHEELWATPRRTGD